MREIKFRAWDKDDSRMYEVAKLDFWGDPDQASCDLAGLDEDGELVELFDIYLGEVEIMQYTGLKDKKGREIYEGDIVIDRYANTYTPIFRNGIYMAYNTEQMDSPLAEPSTQFNVVWRDGCEIIGNVHDGPELIQEVTE